MIGPEAFVRSLRIPAFAEDASVFVNGAELCGADAGSYLHIARTWADGDVIDFTAQLFTIGKMEAARKLASDFGIPYDGGGPSGQQKKSGSKAGKK